MIRPWMGALALLALAGAISPAAPQETGKATKKQSSGAEMPATAAREVAARATPAVLSIRAFADGELVSTGSGFLIASDGVVVTNHHVIGQADRLELELSTGEVFGDVYYVASNPARDLAILRLPATQLPSLSIGDASGVAVGDPVYVVGNPLGLDRTFTDGLISARRVVDGVAYIQISAPISPGSSGGPVLNAGGEVVGIATASVADGQNLNMAVPIGYAEGLLSVATGPRPFAEVATEWRIERQQPAVASAGTGAGGAAGSGPAPVAASPSGAAVATAAGADDGDLPVWQQSVRTQLEEITSIVAAEGYLPTGDGNADMLASDGVGSFALTLEAGEYRAVGVCDDDCADLDLAVGSGGDIIDSDVLEDAFPIVDFTVSQTSSFDFAVQMVDCSTDVCFYTAMLFRKQ